MLSKRPRVVLKVAWTFFLVWILVSFSTAWYEYVYQAF